MKNFSMDWKLQLNINKTKVTSNIELHNVWTNWRISYFFYNFVFYTFFFIDQSLYVHFLNGSLLIRSFFIRFLVPSTVIFLYNFTMNICRWPLMLMLGNGPHVFGNGSHVVGNGPRVYSSICTFNSEIGLSLSWGG